MHGSLNSDTCAAYDKTAPYFNMVFDCEPVYFDYNGRTWLIEFWKGQYGINTGAESASIMRTLFWAPEEYGRTLFQSASDREMLNLSSELTRPWTPSVLSERHPLVAQRLSYGILQQSRRTLTPFVAHFPGYLYAAEFYRKLTEARI